MDDWLSRSACRPGQTFRGEPVDPEWWFPVEPAGPGLAKYICSMCEVKFECALLALEREERHGVWGGMAEDERPWVPRKPGRKK